MTYQELSKKHQDEINDFPMFFAFSAKQMDDGMVQLGVTAFDELCPVGGGGYIRKSDKQKLLDLFDLIRTEKKAYMEDDSFALDALSYELENHEYGHTGDPTEAMEAVGLDMESERGKRLFKLTKKGLGL